MVKKFFQKKISFSVKKIAFWLIPILLLLVIGAIALPALYIGIITARIDTRIEELHNAIGTKFYAWFQPLKKGQVFQPSELRAFLNQIGFEERKNADELVAGQFAWKSPETLIVVRPKFDGAGRNLARLTYQLSLKPIDKDLVIDEIKSDSPDEATGSIENPPKKIASYVAGRLRTQDVVPLSDIPVNLRLAVMAIEDVHFLQHSGVSLRSTFRALWRDLRTRRFAEGGSTITQQLMKNLFFSREKALVRKIKEAIFGILY